jgi:DNA-directed RNA polymerase subunit K/omega
MSPNFKAPDGLDECAALLNHPQYRLIMRARLVQLVFDTDTQVAIRALEMLNSEGAEADDNLSGVDTNTLIQAREKARQMIQLENTREGRENGS